MLDVGVIEDPRAAAMAVEPVKSRLLAALTEPASAATLAVRLGLPRQRINYHLRTLEERGLVELAGERRWGGLTERLMVASAAAYVVSPAALGPVGVEPRPSADRLSASYLVALAARIVREVGSLMRLASRSGKRLATLSLDISICFRSAAERAAFTEDLTEAVAALVSRYHDASAPGGRVHRLVVVAHPLPDESRKEE